MLWAPLPRIWGARMFPSTLPTTIFFSVLGRWSLSRSPAHSMTSSKLHRATSQRSSPTSQTYREPAVSRGTSAPLAILALTMRAVETVGSYSSRFGTVSVEPLSPVIPVLV